MNHKILKRLGFLLMITGLLISSFAAENGSRRLGKVDAQPNIYKFNVNNISTFIYGDGRADVDGNNSGFEFPKGANTFAIYESGFTWGGKENGQVRFGGSTFPSGLVYGKIGQDPEDARMYRVRPDYTTGSMFSELSDGEKSGDEFAIREQYKTDWNEWPWQDGAPYLDADDNGEYNPDPDGNGVYNYGEDIPGVPGADQTIFFIANAADGDKSLQFYGSPAQMIEMQVTVWGYRSVTSIGNMIFKKYNMVNKGAVDYTDFYVGVWCDPDVGGAADDFVGCDTLLSLGYAYNADNDDQQYGNQPPASGFDFFQGPIVEAPGETALVSGELISDWKNLGMTAFYYFVNENGTPYSDPDLDNYSTGALYFYNLLQGKIGSSGEYFEVPESVGGGVTKYPLSGDPVTGEGYIDGMIKEAKDRRFGMSSGPFTLMAGDRQEIVIAEIVAQGANNLNSVTLLKEYDLKAQEAYDKNFVLPSAPTPPTLTYTPYDQAVLLTWDSDPIIVASTESHNLEGYLFEGYNVYQLPSASAQLSEAVKLATYDVSNGVTVIKDVEKHPTGVLVDIVTQEGTDSGLKRSLKVTKDKVNNGIDLFNGTKYYFAVTAYAYSADPEAVPKALESSPIPLTCIPQSAAPGYSAYEDFTTGYEVSHSAGNSDATVSVDVVDPKLTTGHTYEISFKAMHYYMDLDGVWKPTNYPDSVGGALNKDLTGTTMSAIAYTSPNAGTRDLKFILDLVAPDYDYCDGIMLKFPDGIVINSAEVAVGNTYGTEFEPEVDLTNNTVTWGAPAVSGDGDFLGGEVFTVNVNTPTLPITVEFTAYDDGWATGYGEPYASLGNGVVDATGTVEITESAYAFKTENKWKVTDVTLGTDVLTEQTHYDGVDIYPVHGDGNVGYEHTVAVDGQMINILGGYDAPVVYNSVYLNDELLGLDGGVSGPGALWLDDDANFAITDYTYFGDPNGTVNDYLGYGTLEVSALQKDYEFRFTGERETITLASGQTIEVTKEGTGSIATITGARQYSIADHPLNPNPGSEDPFTVRIPFEVWNVDDNRQVNYEIYDRGQADPTSSEFKVWNTDARMYCAIYDTPYSETITTDDPNWDENNYTWMNVWYSSYYTTGDVIKTVYANPIIPGVDKFQWTSDDPLTIDVNQAKTDAEEVNVFPNPYYGVNPQELNKYQRFVTFSHLPAKATIRIFNLAGQLVRTVEKTSTDQFQRWDLLNENALPVASGIYIAYIDMPDIGTTKVLKLAIIQEQQILDKY